MAAANTTAAGHREWAPSSPGHCSPFAGVDREVQQQYLHVCPVLFTWSFEWWPAFCIENLANSIGFLPQESWYWVTGSDRDTGTPKLCRVPCQCFHSRICRRLREGFPFHLIQTEELSGGLMDFTLRTRDSTDLFIFYSLMVWRYQYH